MPIAWTWVILLHFFVHCVNKDDDQWWGKPARKRYSWEGKYWYIHWPKSCWWSCLKHHITAHAHNWSELLIFVKKVNDELYAPGAKNQFKHCVGESGKSSLQSFSPREPGWPIQEDQELCQGHPLQKNTFAIYVSMYVPVLPTQE